MQRLSNIEKNELAIGFCKNIEETRLKLNITFTEYIYEQKDDTEELNITK